MTTPEPGSRLLDAVAHACATAERDGRFSTPATDALRRAVEATPLGHGPEHPEILFGPWDDLPPGMRTALRSWIERDIRRRMDRYVPGSLGTAAVRAARTFDRFLADTGVGGLPRRATVKLAGRLLGGRRTLGARLDRRAALRRWSHDARLAPEDLVVRLGRGSDWLLADWARGIRVDPRARGFHRDAGRNVMWATHLGLDLMITDTGVVLIESNLEAGPPPPSTLEGLIYDVSEQAVRYAVSAGFRRLVWLEPQRIPMYDHVLKALVGEARRLGLTLDIFEDPCMPRRRALPPGISEPNRWKPAQEVPGGSLVLRRTEYGVATDPIVSNKSIMTWALARRFAAKVERRVRVLPMTWEPVGFEPGHGRGLPNLVYKFPDGFAGQGVFFLRARDAEHAVAMARDLDRRFGEPPGLFQVFQRSRTVNGAVYHVRADILVTPLGPVYLTARRLVAGRALVPDLDEGLSTERGVYASNLSVGGYTQNLPPHEAPLVGAAALAVGEAFGEIFAETFITE